MRSSVFRILGGSLLTFAIIWGLVLGWWQSSDYEPSRVDLALYLGALPLAMVGGYLLLRGFIEHLKSPMPAPEAPAKHLLDDDPLARHRAQTAAQERGFTLSLVDAFVLAPGGASADDILAAVTSGKRPEPSSHLSDPEGFPVFVAEIPDLDVAPMHEQLAEDPGPMRRFADDPAMLRTFTLLDGIMPQVQQRVAELFQANTAKLRLHIAWLVPAGFDPAEFAGLRAWLQITYWSELERSDLDIVIVPTVHEVDAFHKLDDVILRANRDPAGDELILLLGAHSAVDERTVEQWSGANLLFSASHQGGKIPGEGAVAILMGSRRLVERLALDQAVTISRASLGVRDKAVDAGGRITGKLLGQLIAALLEASQVEAKAIKAVVADADHRANRITEALEGLGVDFEHLDPATDLVAIGTVNGAFSPLAGLMALACARSKVLADQVPVLCLSNQDPQARAALLAMPFSPEPRIEPSSN